jgi:two-component system cell cycle sensor histidine kinase/response regulator CckA
VSRTHVSRAPLALSAENWRLWVGPLATLALGLVNVAFRRHAWAPQDFGALYLIAVVSATFVGGPRSGWISAAISLAFATFMAFGERGGPDETRHAFTHLVTLAVAIPTVTVLVGVLQRGHASRMQREATARLLLHYRDLLEDLGAVVWELEPGTLRLSFVSRTVEDILGYSPREWTDGESLWEKVHLDDRARVLGLLRSVDQHPGTHLLEYRMTAANGRIVWLQNVLRVRIGPADEVTVRGVMIDASARKQIELALHESERDYRVLMEQAADAVFVTDFHGNYLAANVGACELLGYSRDELQHLRIEDVVQPHEMPPLPLTLGGLPEGQSLLSERRLRRKDGRLIDVEISAKRLDEHRLLSIVRDITARKSAEQELRQALSVLSATLESTADGILVVDLAGRITRYNQQFAEMWRLPEEVLHSGEDDRALAVAIEQLKEPAQFLAKVRELYASPAEESFDVLEFRDGRIFERYSKPQRIGGQYVGRVWSFRDVTQRRRAEEALRASEEQLRQAQKMEAVGRLAGGVAHDFNNILTAIMGNVSLILDDSTALAGPRQRAEEIQKASERAAHLTRQLLAFSRKQMFELKVVDLNTVITEMLKLLKVTVGDDIELVDRIAPQPCAVRVDPGQIEQVILNLVINARDAMPEGGRLEISTSLLEATTADAMREPPYHVGRFVELAVRDTGVGMDDETRARIFEPFFTTKERGKGTGLGLATVYGIVRQSGGYISVHSERGRGSTFRVFLPAVDEPIDRPDPYRRKPGAEPGAETVLVVEDEDLVRTLMCTSIARAGYRVIEARTGADALSLSGRFGGRIDLLLTDVVMPGMGGQELGERLLKARDGIKVLYISGYADDAIGRKSVLQSGVAFLQKPFTMETLVRKVRETLDARATA